jgi:2,3-dihydroxybenzoate-AMP ligase
MTTQPQDHQVVRFPAEFVTRYRESGLWGTRTIGEELRATAAAFPAREAIVDPKRRLTYAELDANTDAIAAGLLATGLHVGDRVLLQVGNTVATVELFYGLIKAGLIPICTLAAHGHHEIDTIGGMTGAKALAFDLDRNAAERLQFADEVREHVDTIERLIVVHNPEGHTPANAVLFDDLRAAPGRVVDEWLAQPAYAAPDDLAVLQLSGGTSGTPKLIPRLHAEYWYCGRATAERWEFTEQDRIAHILPIVHNAGIHGALLAAHSKGACLVLDNLTRGFGMLTTLAGEGVTGGMLPHVLIAGMAGDPLFDKLCTTLRYVSLVGSEPPSAIFDLVASRGVIPVQNFGMTEGIVMATPVDAPDETRRGSVGTPISALDEIKIVDPESPETEVPPGEPGELLVRGPYTIRGYLAAESHNATVFTPDGFYRTGDVFREVHIEGQVAYRVEGRIKEFINRGGEKVNAFEIEELLLRHERIAGAAVVPMPDEWLGERACAYIVSTDGRDVTLDEVRVHLQALGVAKYKWPERIENRTQLPRTAVGKIAKRVIGEDILRVLADETKREGER